MADIFSDPQYDFWENDSEELNDEDVIIEQDQYASYEDDDEELDNQFFNDTIMNDEDELENSIKDDPYLSSWIPTKTVSKPIPTNNTSQYAVDYLTNKGLPKHVAAGIVGNLMKESNLNPNISEKGNTGNGRGIAQWDVRNRWKDLQNYAQSSGKSHTDLDTQLDFVLHEAQQRGDLSKTLQAKTPEEAAMIFGKTYEKPNEKYADWGTRQSTARNLSMQYGGLIKAQSGVNNIPEDLLDGISQESLQEYYDENNAPTLEFDENISEQQNWGNGVANVVQGVGKGIEKVKDWRNRFNEYTNNITKTTSNLIDFTTEQAGIQQNALSLRKFNAQKNSKKYQLNTKSRNSPLIYT